MKLYIFIFVIFIYYCNGKININKNDERFTVEETADWYSIDNNFNIVSGKSNNENIVGWGYYKNEILKDGWGKLYIETNKYMSSENTSIYYEAAGYLEGYLTWSTTWIFSQAYFQNYFNGTSIESIPLPLIDFIKDNYNWMNGQFVQQVEDGSIYNQQVSNVISQFEGLSKGYQFAADSDKQLTTLQLLILQYIGDLEDVAGYLEYEMSINKTDSQPPQPFKPYSFEQVEEILVTKGRCSGLVKVTPDFGELFVSHSTWGSYYTAGYRVFKRLIIADPTISGTEILYSSYAGVLTSDDDFFMIPTTNLVIIETTNDILNTSLYQYVTPKSLLYFVRSIVANRMSTRGDEWVANFIAYNSGTYSNQWMIVDYKLFTPYQPLKPNTLWIIEQVPGTGSMSEDVTNILALGYWPSMNRPFFPEIFQAMGYAYYQELYGDIISYQLNPRSKIFRRDHSTIESITDMQSIMTSNNYKTDPFSDGYPGNAIAARYDLGSGPSEPNQWSIKLTHGAIDSKVVSFALLQQNQVVAINGMAVTPSCPPFTWSTSNFSYIPHFGSPDTFNFDWVTIKLDKK